MIKLDKLEKLGWDSLSFRAYIVRPELEYVREDIVTHIDGMDFDSQYIKDFFMNIYVTNPDEDDTIVYIEDFYINKQFRSCGIGSYIIDNLEDILYYYANTIIDKIIVLPQPRVVNKSKGLQNISEKNKKKDVIMKRLVSFYNENGFEFIKNTKYMVKKIR